MGKVPGSKYESGNKSFRRQISKKNQQLDALLRAFPQETKSMLDSIGSDSKAEMQRIIMESESSFGALRTSFGIGKGKGRYDTGAMHDNVAYTTEIATERISLRVGWLYKFEEYFGFQDSGFLQRWKTAGFNFMTGKFVFIKRENPVDQEGIHALRDARMYAVNELQNRSNELGAKLIKAYRSG